MGRRHGIAGLLGLALLGPAAAEAEPIRVDGVSPTPRDRIATFTVRGDGVRTPLIAFQERARRVIEAHMHAEIVSMREALSRGGASLNRRLAGCQADPKCYADLIGRTVDARYLLVITATHLDDLRLVGARLLDLEAQTILGESIEEVPAGQTDLDAVAARIRACIPAKRWEPFGSLVVDVPVEGAQVSLQGRLVGNTPLPEIGYLYPGTYRVEVSKPGFLPASTQVAIRQGIRARAQVRLQAPEEESGGSVWLWVGLGALVVAGAAATGVVLATGGGGGDPTFCSAPDPARCAN